MNCADLDFPGRYTRSIQTELSVYTQPQRIEYLDSIRGLAALCVLLSHTLKAFAWPASYIWVCHWPFVSIFFNGPEAVGMFFVLSGYVLSRPYVPDPAKADLGRRMFLPTFYLRRLIRIWPPFFFAFLVSLFAQKFLFTQPATVPPVTAWLAQFWQVQLTMGDFFRQCVFMLHDIPKMLLNQDWSLRVELKASVLLPLFLMFSLPRWLPVLGLMMAGILWFSSNGSCFGLFAMGVLVARYERRWLAGLKTLGRMAAGGLLVAGLVLYQALGFESHLPGRETTPNVAGWLLTGLGCVLILLSALASRSFQRFLNHRTLLLLGRVSYSFYLLQFIIILCFLPPWVHLLNRCGAVQNAVIFPLVMLASVAATLVFAVVAYHLIELPVVNFGHRLTRNIQVWLKPAPGK